MLELISSGRNTQLHTFPTLATKFTYAHHEGETQHFSVFPGKKLFVTVNRSTGFELLRSCDKNGTEIIQRVKKRQMNDVECGACSSSAKGEIALGLTTGHIRFFSIKTAEVSGVKFRPDQPDRQITYLGYSSGDDMLASIYDNGDINLYGLNTGVKMYTQKLDNNSIRLCFNPIKRFNMAIASYTGAVTVFDTQSKRIIFKDKTAHSAPCSDLCWSQTSADTLLTVGYDCKMKVFDLRSKVGRIVVKHTHPLSAAALSDCGVYCCAGNLKGELVSYDMRNPKSPLHYLQAHDGIVTGVHFIPSGAAAAAATSSTPDVSDSAEYLSLGSTNRISVGSSVEQHSSAAVVKANNNTDAHSSFLSFLDKCGTRPRESIYRRDSMAAMMEVKAHTFDDLDDSRSSCGRRLSTGYVNVASRRRTKPVCENIIAEDVNDVFSDDCADRKVPPVSRLSGSFASNVLHETMSPNVMMTLVSPPSAHAMDVDKENNDAGVTLATAKIDPFNCFVEHDKHSSTPNQQLKPKYIGYVEENNVPEERNIVATATADDERHQSCAAMMQALEFNMRSRMDSMEATILAKLQHHSMSIHFNLWTMEETRIKGLQDDVQNIHDGIASLAQNDDFLQDYLSTKQENEELRRQLHQLGKRF